MNETTTRERIFKRIRSASPVHADNIYENVNQEDNIYNSVDDDDLLVVFARELNNIGGSFVYCENKTEFINNLAILMKSREIDNIFSFDKKIAEILKGTDIKVFNDENALTKAPYVLTTCEALVARTGSVVISSAQSAGRAANFLPATHIVVASASQAVETVKDAMELISEKYESTPSMVSFITGPSRTADIEKTLVMGAHGPRELIVFVVEDF